MMHQIQEQCTLGVHASIIIPPSWIIKLPRKVRTRRQPDTQLMLIVFAAVATENRVGPSDI